MAEKTDAERQTEALENLKAAFNQLKGKVDATVETKKADETKQPEKKVYTRAQLRKAVNDGTLTEDQMDEILERQLREELTAKISTNVSEQTQHAKREAKIEAQIDALIDAHPDLKNKESDLFGKVAAKFNQLTTERNYPKDHATELTAIEMVVGTAAPKGRKRELQVHEETGGSGGGRDRDADDAPEWSKGIPSKNRAYYEKQIAKGVYSGVNDPRLKKEVERLRKAN